MVALGLTSGTIRSSIPLLIERQVARAWPFTYVVVGDSLAAECPWKWSFGLSPLAVTNLAARGAGIRDITQKRPPGQKSAEALARARAALANVDANRPASADALIGPGLTDTRPAPVDVQPRQADVPPRQADVRARPIDVPPRAAAIEAAPQAADVQPQTEQPRTATGANLQRRSPDVPPGRGTPVDIQ